MLKIIPKKKALEEVYERRNLLSQKEVIRKSNKVGEKFFQLDEVKNSLNILFYASENKGEIYTKKMIDTLIGMGKVVSLPRTNKIRNSFVRGAFLGWDKTTINEEGYIESTVSVDANFDDIDLIVVPAVAVAMNGKRIGYGNPYYVNLISKTLAPRIILAFEFQLFPEIETTGNDFSVDKIVTERRIINLKNGLRF